MSFNRLALALTLGIAATLTARGGELQSARFLIAPERPYVGQPFEIRLELEVSPGAEAQDLRIDGISLDPCATIGPYKPEARRAERRSDRTVDILSFAAIGRATKPWRQEFHGTLHANLVEHRTFGFFSSTYSSSAAIRLGPLLVEFRPLPTTGVPPGFQGAIGTFRVTGTLEPAQAMPGDLVNLNITLLGNGWLGDAQVLLPQPGPDFRVYPPQELARDEKGALALRQVVIPLTTNATRIGMASLPYFDPVAGVYRVATAGPFALTLNTARPGATVPAVKRFDAQPPPTESVGEMAVTATVGQARRWLPFAAALILAVVVTSVLHAWRPWLAIIAGIVVLAAGLYACQRWTGHIERQNRTMIELVTARLCPSPTARALFILSPGRVVTPVEKAENWVLVEANGHRGWVPAATLHP